MLCPPAANVIAPAEVIVPAISPAGPPAILETLSEKLGADKIGMMFCLGHCYETSSFH